MKRLVILFSIALVGLTLASCGGGGHKQHQHYTTPASHCTPNDWASICNSFSKALSAAPPKSGAGYGIDFAWSCPSPTYSFAVSYLDTGDRSKGWSSYCLSRWHSAGKKTAAVWESSASRALGGYNAGRSDAFAAIGEEQRLGIPTSRPVYFAVDFDTSVYGSNSIRPYFSGVRSVIGTRTGVYGGKTTIQYVQDIAPWRWQTAAWSYGYWVPGGQLQQYAFSNAVDWDRSYVSDYGQTPSPTPTPVINSTSYNSGFNIGYATGRSVPYKRGYTVTHSTPTPASGHDFNLGYNAGWNVGHNYSIKAGTSAGNNAPKSPTTWGNSWSLGYDVGWATGVGNPYYRYFIRTPHGTPASSSAFNGGWKIGYPGGYNSEFNTGYKSGK